MVDITKAARIGSNELKVNVTNVWHNLLVGQALKPDAFNGAGMEKVWTSSMPQYGPNETLLDTGHLGPVLLSQAVEIPRH